MRTSLFSSRARSHASTLIFAALLVSACQPKLKPGFFACKQDKDCPSHWYCHSDQRCYATHDDDMTHADGGMDSDAHMPGDGDGDGDAPMKDAGHDHDAGHDAGTDAMVSIECGEAGSCSAGDHATPTCEQGQCGVSCDAHWVSCTDPANDCEQSTETRSVCGTDCTHGCATGQHCANSQCHTLDLLRAITAKNTASNGESVDANSVAIDSQGLVTVVGTINGSFDPGNGTTIYSGSSGAGYLVRYTEQGSVNTARTFVSSDDTKGSSLSEVAVDAGDSIYVAGLCQTGVKFGGSKEITALGADDACIASFNSENAVFQWQTSFGGGNTARGGEPPVALAVSGGTVFVFGSFSGGIVGTASMDVGGSTLNNKGGEDFYLVRIDSFSGDIVGGTSYGEGGNQHVSDVAVDSNGDVVVVGRFDTDFKMGDFALKTHGQEDIFMARFDANGSVLSAVAFGGSDPDQGLGVGIAPDGTTWLFGSVNTTNGAVNFGGKDLTGMPNGSDLFVARYTRGGQHISSIVFGSSGNEPSTLAGGDASADNLGNFYIAAQVAGDLTVGDIPVKVHGEMDILLASFDPAGGVRYATRIGSENAMTVDPEFPHALAVTRADGPLYLLPSVDGSASVTLKDGTTKQISDYAVLRYDP